MLRFSCDGCDSHLAVAGEMRGATFVTTGSLTLAIGDFYRDHASCVEGGALILTQVPVPVQPTKLARAIAANADKRSRFGRRGGKRR